MALSCLLHRRAERACPVRSMQLRRSRGPGCARGAAFGWAPSPDAADLGHDARGNITHGVQLGRLGAWPGLQQCKCTSRECSFKSTLPGTGRIELISHCEVTLVVSGRKHLHTYRDGSVLSPLYELFPDPVVKHCTGSAHQRIMPNRGQTHNPALAEVHNKTPLVVKIALAPLRLKVVEVPSCHGSER